MIGKLKISGKHRSAGVLLIALMSLLITCEDLDFADPNSPVIESATIQALITGAEAGLRIDQDIYLAEISVIGREAYYFETADPRYTGELLRGPFDAGGFLLTRPWSARYNVIKNCNIILDKAADLTDAEDKAGVVGFAKTLIAHELMIVLNMLDDNGIKLDFSGDLSIPFATKAESFAAIDNYLDDADTELGNAGSTFGFLLSEGFDGFDTPATFSQFNRALRARSAIQQNSWQAALTALGDSFIDETADLDLGVYMVYSTSANDLTNGLYENPEAANVKWMGQPTFATDAESGDARFAAKVITRASRTFDALTSTLGVTWLGSSTDPTPIIRNEELILLRAEANIGLTNYSVAETDINIIRTAAGLDDTATLEAANALDQLLHEKRYSLFLEGHRWGDMRRYDKLDELPLDRENDAVIPRFPKPETEVPG